MGREAKLRQKTNKQKNHGKYDVWNSRRTSQCYQWRIKDSLYPATLSPPSYLEEAEALTVIRTVSPDLLTAISTAHSLFREDQCHTAQEVITRRHLMGPPQLSFLTLLLCQTR